MIATVYENGKEIKKILFSDLFTEAPEKIALGRKLSVKGGGWVTDKILTFYFDIFDCNLIVSGL